ncbi:aminoglycoside phosphotransferase/kinase family protein [Nocardioides acrostichi]|uniref:Aminoglycoside phosphotransferase n=1 Tax=Nocardioides acrostichi TaxID=2784339 RepID=A0A930Y6Z5_9ACTN|nr:aminoglycoside phosphotransferase [Nocardioides acrostichi]MBF4162890.1 aminoglycoside phosphotransferase [Nocardioides acrostichi]
MDDGPSEQVLDLFAVPANPERLPGGPGRSVRAGDLVLSPGRDADVAAWLSPALARLGVRLDEDPRRTARDLRVGVPVPARDGSWVVEGWGATRFEPGTEVCHDVEVIRRAGHLLHAHLAVAFPTRPPLARTDRWARAEAVAFGEVPIPDDTPSAVRELTAAALAVADQAPSLEPAQLVHVDLAGNVLLDLAGAPLVVDVSPAWRAPSWAEAVAVLDAVASLGAPVGLAEGWRLGAQRGAWLRAGVFRLLSDPDPDVSALCGLLLGKRLNS